MPNSIFRTVNLLLAIGVPMLIGFMSIRIGRRSAFRSHIIYYTPDEGLELRPDPDFKTDAMVSAALWSTTSLVLAPGLFVCLRDLVQAYDPRSLYHFGTFLLVFVLTLALTYGLLLFLSYQTIRHVSASTWKKTVKTAGFREILDLHLICDPCARTCHCLSPLEYAIRHERDIRERAAFEAALPQVTEHIATLRQEIGSAFSALTRKEERMRKKRRRHDVPGPEDWPNSEARLEELIQFISEQSEKIQQIETFRRSIKKTEAHLEQLTEWITEDEHVLQLLGAHPQLNIALFYLEAIARHADDIK